LFAINLVINSNNFYNMKKTYKNNKIDIFIENIIIITILILIISFMILILKDLIYYIICPKIYEILQPLPLTDEDLIQLFKSKGIKACKEWPFEYPQDPERPCYVTGIDKTGYKYCNVFTTQEESITGLCSHICQAYWDHIKNK
jgi:hypothetical protein